MKRNPATLASFNFRLVTIAAVLMSNSLIAIVAAEESVDWLSLSDAEVFRRHAKQKLEAGKPHGMLTGEIRFTYDLLEAAVKAYPNDKLLRRVHTDGMVQLRQEAARTGVVLEPPSGKVAGVASEAARSRHSAESYDDDDSRDDHLGLTSNVGVVIKEFHFNAGDYFFRHGDLAAAAAAYRRAYYLTGMAGRRPHVNYSLSSWEVRRADEERRRRYLSELNERLELIPFDCKALRYRAELHSLLGQTEQALADLETLKQIEPHNAENWLQIAEFHLAAGEMEEALTTCQVAIDLQPQASDGFLLRGRIEGLMGDLQTAIRDWRMAAVCKTGYKIDEAYMRLVWAYAAADDPQVRDPRSALAIIEMPDAEDVSRIVPEVVAAAYAANSDFESAIEWQSRALAADELHRDTATAEARLKLYRANQPLRLSSSELLNYFEPNTKRNSQNRDEDNAAVVESLRELRAKLSIDAKSGLVTAVDFRGLQVTDELFESLADLPALSSVSLQEASFLKSSLAHLGKLRSLRHLDLRNAKVGNDGLAKISFLNNLQTLRLSGENGSDHSDDSGMSHIAELTKLRVLELNYLWVSSDGISQLARLKALEELHLGSTLIDDSALEFIASTFPKLKKLRISQNSGISDEGVRQVAKISGLQELDLSENPEISDAGLTEFSNLTQLTRLNLWRVPITDVGLKHLEGMKGLSWLNLDSTRVTDKGLASLSGLKNLRYLSLDGTNISDHGSTELAALQSLVTLRVTRTRVTRQGVAKLQALLPTTTIQF